MYPIHRAEWTRPSTLVLIKMSSAWAEWYAQTSAFSVRREIRFLKRSSYIENERTPCIADDVGFTEEESQAWLRNFRLLQLKNGESPAINVSRF